MKARTEKANIFSFTILGKSVRLLKFYLMISSGAPDTYRLDSDRLSNCSTVFYTWEDHLPEPVKFVNFLIVSASLYLNQFVILVFEPFVLLRQGGI